MMSLQDGPFLAVRLYVIIKNQTLSYSILFFTLKNVILLMVQTYRLFVIGCCHTDPVKARVGMVPVTSEADTADRTGGDTVPNELPSNNYQRTEIPQTYSGQYHNYAFS